MTFDTKVLVGAATDFVLTAGTAIMAVGHMPDQWGWLVAVIGGVVAMAKHIRAMYLVPEGQDG